MKVQFDMPNVTPKYGLCRHDDDDDDDDDDGLDAFSGAVDVEIREYSDVATGIVDPQFGGS